MFRFITKSILISAIASRSTYAQVVIDPTSLMPVQTQAVQPPQSEVDRGHALQSAEINQILIRMKLLIEDGNRARSRDELKKIQWSIGYETSSLARLHEVPKPEYHMAPEYDLARYWYIQAVNNGYTPAIFPLAQMYWDGRGGPQDKERAKYLWMWSVQNNDARSLSKLNALGFDPIKEREAAFAKAQSKALATSGDHTKDAAEGAAMLFGLLLLGTMAQGSESPECQAYHRALLVGGGIPQGTVIPKCP